MRHLVSISLILISFGVLAQAPKPPDEKTVRLVFNQEFGQNLLFLIPIKCLLK